MVKREIRETSGRAAIFMTAVYVVCFLLLTVFGASVYREICRMQDENREFRATLSYLSSCVLSGNGADTIEVQDYKGSDCLLIREGDGTYGRRFFLMDGTLYEYYGRAEGVIDADEATSLGSADFFRVSVNPDGTFTASTDRGSVVLSERAGREFAGTDAAAEAEGAE